MNYRFYGSDTPAIAPCDTAFFFVKDQRHLYDLLRQLWCKETCAPRMAEQWSEENPTLGQCSITAFLVQDIFGGDVYGVPLGDGNYHCFNQVGDVVFDLTSEQFGDTKLDYGRVQKQSREVHFAKEEKRIRYELLKKKLMELRD